MYFSSKNEEAIIAILERTTAAVLINSGHAKFQLTKIQLIARKLYKFIQQFCEGLRTRAATAMRSRFTIADIVGVLKLTSPTLHKKLLTGELQFPLTDETRQVMNFIAANAPILRPYVVQSVEANVNEAIPPIMWDLQGGEQEGDPQGDERKRARVLKQWRFIDNGLPVGTIRPQQPADPPTWYPPRPEAIDGNNILSMKLTPDKPPPLQITPHAKENAVEDCLYVQLLLLEVMGSGTDIVDAKQSNNIEVPNVEEPFQVTLSSETPNLFSIDPLKKSN